MRIVGQRMNGTGRIQANTGREEPRWQAGRGEGGRGVCARFCRCMCVVEVVVVVGVVGKRQGVAKAQKGWQAQVVAAWGSMGGAGKAGKGQAGWGW